MPCGSWLASDEAGSLDIDKASPDAIAGCQLPQGRVYGSPNDHPRINANKSALIVAASVVGIPCGNPGYDFNVPFGSNFADKGAEFS